MEKKRCYRCGKDKALILFMKDNSTYQIKSSKGRCLACRKCVYNMAIEHGGIMQRIDGKFQFVSMDKKELVKKFMRWIG